MIIQIVASFIATTGFGILFGLEGKKLFCWIKWRNRMVCVPISYKI